jgi:hypothetical protein
MEWVSLGEGRGAKVAWPSSNPDEKRLEQLLGEAVNAADFGGNNLPAEIASHLDLSALQVGARNFHCPTVRR